VKRCHATLVLCAAWALGCKDADLDPDCVRACGVAERCGLFPSALGGGSDATDNCAARCTLSSTSKESPRSAVVDCLQSNDAGQWCTEEGECRVAERCLRGRLPAEVLGTTLASAKLYVAARGDESGHGWWRAACQEPSAGSRTGEQNSADDCRPDGGLTCAERAAAFCVANAITTITLFVQHGAQRDAERSLRCTAAFGSDVVLGRFPRGVASIGLELYAAAARDPSSEVADAGSEPELQSAPDAGPSAPDTTGAAELCLGRLTREVVLTRETLLVSIPLLPLTEPAYDRCEASVPPIP